MSLQVVMWINQNFLLTKEIEAKDGELDVMFLSLRTGNPLVVHMDSAGNVREIHLLRAHCA